MTFPLQKEIEKKGSDLLGKKSEDKILNALYNINNVIAEPLQNPFDIC